MFQTLQLEYVNPHIAHIKLNRPNKRNAMNLKMIEEIPQIIQELNNNSNLRCIIITGNGKHFSSGIDLKDSVFQKEIEGLDNARKGIKLYNIIKELQESMTSLEKINIPILMGVHNACLGLACELILAADYRICTKNSFFEFKEVDLGIAADMGLIQRLQINCGNQSLVRELIFSGNRFDSQTAIQLGLVSQVYENEEIMVQTLVQKAILISEKSPVAIWTIKNMLNKQKHDIILNNLDYLARINVSSIQTTDIQEALNAILLNKQPQYPKL
ncbi:hypothetical protein IMG5_155810 [Ichthyophthirius multifiliis]|uniref:Enoyl-CoA hydratase n=1 Tax=Ichthyophthirius multifiliis TaxID=5932 RepID=G0QZC8_ICHMU|nr:hypothetical protein IMG5_155810 [Ichthyophthirius multifiliis]EGR29431.1 hypothetical protein IMG5_155810 [Ichthyophthirius multifiliis]|eukprot:XP_004030667.1 hypothetical protein IMG5_155810 [Ichthyophthirius multifiliis]